MIVCHEPKFAFIRNPKTASRSVTKILQDNFTVWDCSDYHGWILPEACQDYFTFMFVRNPFSRTVSAWLHVCEDRIRVGRASSPSLAQFVDYGGFGLHNARNYFKQSDLLKWIEADTKSKVTILKYENLAEEIRNLPFMPEGIELPHIGNSGKDWMSFYTPEIEERVRQALAEDFETFGYHDRISISM